MAATKKEAKVVAMREAAMTLNEAALVREELIGYFQKGRDVVMDLSHVSDCDTSGIQLLCSAEKTAVNTNKTFSIIAASDCIKAAASRTGIRFDFGKS